MFSDAKAVRRDLTGEFAQAALTHYHRRQYDLAERFAKAVLESTPAHWGMRKCLARIHIRLHRWDDADKIITALIKERARDLEVQHLRGWRYLRSGDYREAFSFFTQVLAHKGDRVETLRAAAECLYRLERSHEALDFLNKAKEVESDNPFVLELEARIHEESGEFRKALVAMRLAVNRNPSSWRLRHRLARIQYSLGNRYDAIEEVSVAVSLDPAQFLPLNTLVSWLLDQGDLKGAAQELPTLRTLASNARERQLVDHLEARERHQASDFDSALSIVNQQIQRGINKAASLGLMAEIKLDQINNLSSNSLASVSMLLAQVENAIQDCELLPDHDPKVLEKLKSRVETVKALLKTLEP
ncbi:MAG: tetratricopeptide repeat protein [Gammaproteobacteria bacterium]|nr:tetratricopeptide repeat protein [Gammaproteobacteria bacterium]MYH85958.1 tetratricopeptide repeat protein [Gammaproteobacteria bacterium]